MTGRNIKRPDYQQMKQDILKNKSTVVITRTMDRLHRNAKNQLSDLEWFEQNNVRYVAVVDGIDTHNNDSKLITTIKAAVAEDFSEQLSKSTRAGLLEGAKQCRHLGGLPPYGYIVTPEGFYDIDEHKAKAVKKIFNSYLQGMSYEYIIGWLEKNNYKTAKGKKFTKSSIISILTNKKYKEIYVYDRAVAKDSEGRKNNHKSKEKYIEIPDGMPAIISTKDFDKAQEKMKNRSQIHSNYNGKHYYPLNGRIYCAECGSRYSGNVQYTCKGEVKRKYYQYRCSKCKDNPSVNADKLNSMVFYALKLCLINTETNPIIMEKLNKKLQLQTAQKKSRENEIERKIKEIEKAQDNLTKYLEAGTATKTAIDKIEKNEKELELLRNELSADSTDVEAIEIDEEKYKELVKKLLPYLCNVRSAETIQLLDETVKDIQIGTKSVTINFKEGVVPDKGTVNFFNMNS